MDSVHSSKTCWRDRRRVLTMPVGTTYYEMNDICISITDGLFRLKNENIYLHDIRNVKYHRGLRQMLVNQGDIIVTWRDSRMRTDIIRNIKEPRAVTELILQKSDAAKLRHLRRGRRFEDHFWDDRYDNADED